jgi:steroid delta-isomerase
VRRHNAVVALASFGLLSASVQFAAAQDAATAIRAALETWTGDFNAGRSDKVCELFAPDLRADFRGQPERGYDEQCRLLRRSLSDRTRRYHNALAIEEIIVAGDLAVVRLTWTSTVTRERITRKRARPLRARERGMDIFRKQPDGSWKISRYIAYEVPR